MSEGLIKQEEQLVGIGLLNVMDNNDDDDEDDDFNVEIKKEKPKSIN
jgi:hypothetical protein